MNRTRPNFQGKRERRRTIQKQKLVLLHQTTLVLTDGGEKTWSLDLRFDKSSDTFYISRGWRSLCNENRKEAGGSFEFKLVGNGEIPTLGFCPTESSEENASEKEPLPVEPSRGQNICKEDIKKKHLRCGDSTPLWQNRFVTLTLNHDAVTNSRLYLPVSFFRENGLDKPGVITLLCEDGTTWLVYLRREAKGRMYLGKGWNIFAKAKGIKMGESVTLESIWENETPILRLVDTYSTPRSPTRFVTLTLTHHSLKKGRQYLPLKFTSENGMNKPGMITLLGKDGTKWLANLLQGKQMCVGKGWIKFARENGLEIGESFTLESIWENGTHMLSLFNTESTSDTRQQGEFCSKASEKESLLVDPNMLNADYISTKKHPHSITKEAGDDDDQEDMGKYCSKASEKEPHLVYPNMLNAYFISTKKHQHSRTQEAGGDDSQEDMGECFSKASEKELVSTEPNDENIIRKAEHSIEETRETSSVIQYRFVTLTLTLEDVRECKLILPSQFMKANDINKLGKITLLGKNKMKWSGYLLSKDGLVALGCGWEGFCESNDVKTGDSFTLEFLSQQDRTPVLKFSPNSGDLSLD